MAIPSRYRGDLEDWCSGHMVMTVAASEKGAGRQGCLWLYPLPDWEKLEKKLQELPTLNAKAARLRRFLIGYASECELDSQGRVMVPGQLRQFAGLDKKITLIGQLNKFELWSESAWEAQENDWIAGEDLAGFDELSQLSF